MAIAIDRPDYLSICGSDYSDYDAGRTADPCVFQVSGERRLSYSLVFAKMPWVVVEQIAQVQVVLRHAPPVIGLSKEGITMAIKRFFDFDMRDLAVMIGVSSLASAAIGALFEKVIGIDVPSVAAIAIAVAAFIAGKLLSDRMEGKPDDRFS